ncbi:hypothetical protein FRB99_008893 [Tulasnella sp. 403]|nr:hypothetical protein FRB99_008893 [Tulasnella sp. 403]
MASNLTFARYGKDKVRVFRIVRNGDWHEVVEYTVCALLEGEIETSYTEANNKCVVATDSVKNTVNVLAKTSPHVLSPALFALHIGLHFVTKYSHISKSVVTIEQLKWTRIAVGKNAEPHKHSFVRDGDEKVIIKVEVDASEGKDKVKGSVIGGLKDLLVLKSSGSAFEDFYVDEFTTLTPVSDRILSTAIDYEYTINLPAGNLTIDGLAKLGEEVRFKEVAESARQVTLDLFATDESASVQATLFKMAQEIIASNPTVGSVTYRLPNKHYIPVNLAFMKLENLSPPEKAEVFTPVESPSGLIMATSSRVIPTSLASKSSSLLLNPPPSRSSSSPSSKWLEITPAPFAVPDSPVLNMSPDICAPTLEIVLTSVPNVATNSLEGKCILRKSQCTYNTRNAKSSSVSSRTPRRASLSSLVQQPQPNFLYGSQPPNATFPQHALDVQPPSNSPFDLAPFSSDFSSANLRSQAFPPPSSAQPVPMPNGQFLQDDGYSLLGSQQLTQDTGYHLSNGLPPQSGQTAFGTLGFPLPRLGSLSYPAQQLPQPQGQRFDGRPAPSSHQQQYVFGTAADGSPFRGPLPSLVPDSSGYLQSAEGSPEMKSSAAAHLEYRRESMGLPGPRPYGGPDAFQPPSLQNYPGSFHSTSVDVLLHQQYPSTYSQFPHFQQPNQHGSPAQPINRHLETTRLNERTPASRGLAHSGSNDDASSVSDFGGSNNSGGASPVPSTHSISGLSSSRPTSSTGSLGGRDGGLLNPTAAQSDNFVSSLQGAIPLPTPLQLNSFNTFQTQGSNAANINADDRTPGATAASGTGDSAMKSSVPYPPYQNFEHMNLDEAASFAAAAKNATSSNAYSRIDANEPFSQFGLHLATNPHVTNPFSNQAQTAVLSAGGKEKAINELKEFWSAFISEPLTGGGNGSTNSNTNVNNGHSLTKRLSMPSLKTPTAPISSERSSMLEMNHPTPRVLYPGEHSTILGMTFKPDPPLPLSRSTFRAPSGKDGEGSRDVDMKSPDNTSSSSRARSATAFAVPFPPGSKEARDWLQHRSQALAAMDFAAIRPGYKRLPSQTLGPEHSKKARDGMDTDGDSSDGGSKSGGATPLSADAGYQVSYPQPGYYPNGVSAAQGTWMRQRSISTPVGLRPNFEWKILPAGRN